MLFLFLIIGLLPGSFGVPLEATAPAEPTYLYRVTLIRAAPGRLLELIELFKSRQPAYAQQGDAAPFWMRHSQGDQWDLLLLYPMESYAAYYHPDRVAQRGRNATPAAIEASFQEMIAWKEDLFSFGPDLGTVQGALAGAGFFHVEMFRALPGRQADLYQEREMENAYLKALGRPLNLIFIGDQGAAWDAFTIGCYRGLKHFAESADIPLEEEERAARSAGFEGVRFISPYLRSLIAMHRDTLAVAIP